jgi:hypothetical protein
LYHSLACLSAMTLFTLGIWSQLSPALSLYTWPPGVTHPKVTFSCSWDTCLGPASKHLVPFTDGVDGIIYQILKIVSKSPFIREANKDWQNDSSGRMPALQV